jgi:hypothetical protein
LEVVQSSEQEPPWLAHGNSRSRSTIPVQALIASRKRKLEGDEAEKWKRFVELRRPEKLRAWAEAAGLTHFNLAGKGAISADPKVGQGVWLWFTKQE